VLFAPKRWHLCREKEGTPPAWPSHQGGTPEFCAGFGRLRANSGLPHGPDTGVESEGFVPLGARDAVVADRLTPGNPHPGDNVVLRISAARLRAAGVRPGNLLVATEGAALTDAVSCSAAGCQVRLVSKGPGIAHLEGHIAFARLR
jgi:hypothetical protein